MLGEIDIVKWAESRIGFYVDRTYDDGRWVIKDTPITLADYHRDLLRHIFTPDAEGRLPYDVVGWCEPAKGGKSAIAGLCAQYMALHGEPNSSVVLASNKRNQAASVMYGSFAESLKANPALRIEPGRYETRLPNGNTVRAIPSNSRGEAGARFSLALFDELWGYVYQDAERLWSEFKTDPTRQISLKMAVGYAGYLESELWLDLLNSGYKGEPVPELSHITNDGEPACWRNGRTFVFWSHETRQPWQTEQWIESQRRILRPAEFKRMILTEFVEGAGDFIDAAAWAACIDPELRPLQGGSSIGDDKPPFDIYIGLDLALAPGGDDCALVGVYGRDGQVFSAFHRVWRGRDRLRKLQLGRTVLPYILNVSRRYNLKGVLYDPWQAQRLAEELRAAKIRCIEVPQTHASRGPRDTRLWELVSNQQLCMYDCKEFRGAASGANAQELGNGMIFLKKAGRGKIDLLIALSNCASEAAGRVRGKVGMIRYA